MFEECYQHAHKLAAEAGLTITNIMSALLLATTKDDVSILITWINNTCAVTNISDLTHEEHA